MVSSFVMKEDTCFLFLIGDPCGDLKLEKIQQREFNKDLRTSLIFQQGEFDMGVSSVEEIGIWESMGSSNFSKRSNWAKLDIWTFHELFDI